MGNFSNPRIGVGIIVVKDGKILLGERCYSHGNNTWCPPGGHLELWETPAECAVRELQEETGLEALNVEPGPWTNDYYREDGKHYITIYMKVTEFTGTLDVKEPDKCKRWEWFSMDDLPQPLFLSFTNLLESGNASFITSTAKDCSIA